jgi:proteasome accessory factor B
MPRGEPLILLLKVLRFLQDAHAASLGPTIEEIAEACEVSTRTIRRKLKALEEAGIPLKESADDDRRKRFTIDHKLMPAAHVSFEPFEAAALFVADGMMAAMEGLPLAKEARAALEKATQGVPISFRAELKNLVDALHGSLQSSHEYAPFGRRFVDLIDAIAERWPVEIDYRSLASSTSPGVSKTHRIHPYLIHCQTGTVYVVARKVREAPENGRDRFITYALDRIEAVRVHDDEPFVRDPSFDAQAFVAESFNGYHEGEVVTVKVRFEAEVARVIRERTWHPSQSIEEQPEGAVVVTFRTAGPTGVLHWSKSFLPHARVLEPPQLAERQREEARAWLERLEGA